MKKLEIKNITVGYSEEVDVLKNVSLFLRENEIVSIIGANGAGKTTLIRTISGLIHPKQGDILYEGNSIIQAKPHQIVHMGIIQVPEDRGTFDSLTTEENLTISCWNEKNLKRNLDTVYNFFPALIEKRAVKAQTLSGGQRKMLSIGKAIMGEPKLLLLDDISMGLAPKIVIELYEMLKNLIQSLKIPTLVVEQIVDIALEFSTRGYVLLQGEVVMSESSDKLFENEKIKTSYLGI